MSGSRTTLDNIDLPGLIAQRVFTTEKQDNPDFEGVVSREAAHYIDQDFHTRLGLVRFYAHPRNRDSIIAAYIVDQTNSLVLTELDPCASSLGVQPTPEPILLKDIQEFVKEGAGKPIMTVQINPQYHQEVLWFLPEEEQT